MLKLRIDLIGFAAFLCLMPNSNPPQIIRYIDPLVDFAFKKIFGSEPNKDLLIDFLNQVFRGRKIITDLTYKQNEHHGDNAEEGVAIFDLYCLHR